ncbi:hypothetical protein BGW39_010070, partial [Mortierella sp. 14UC]
MDFLDEDSASEPEEVSDDDDGVVISPLREKAASCMDKDAARQPKVNCQTLMDELIFTAVDTDNGYYDQLSTVEKMEHGYTRKSLAEAQGITASSEGAYRSTFLPFKDFCDNYYSDPNKKPGDETDLATLTDPPPYTSVKKIFFKRKKIERSKVPITGEGVKGTFNLALYMDYMRKRGEEEEPLKVPYSRSKVEQVYSALRHLWRLQVGRLHDRNLTGDIRKSSAIKTAIDQYAHSLVGGVLRVGHVRRNANSDVVQTGRDISSNNAATNYYTPRQHISCLLHTWTQLVTPSSKWIREHFNLAVRHNMLLRDEDFRRLNLSSISCDTIPQQPGGTQKILQMIFTMHGDKISKHGTSQYGIAVDIKTSADAVNKEPWPDMNDISWPNMKLLASEIGGDP